MVVTYEELTFELLGHSSVRIETDDGVVVYIDPWGDMLNEEPHDGDLVLITHDDFDHYDPDTIEAVAGPDVVVGVFEAVDTENLSFDPVDLPLSGMTTVGDFDVRTIPAYNDPNGAHVDEEGNPFHAEGEVTGILIEIASKVVFYPSDTDFLDHHADAEADVLIPPIGGHYTMNRTEAAEMARAIEPSVVLPVHYGTFDATQADVDAFVEEIRDAGIDAEVL